MTDEYHPAGCWRYHTNCAIDKIEQMEKEMSKTTQKERCEQCFAYVRKLEKERDVLREVVEVMFGATENLEGVLRWAKKKLDEADKAREGG